MCAGGVNALNHNRSVKDTYDCNDVKQYKLCNHTYTTRVFHYYGVFHVFSMYSAVLVIALTVLEIGKANIPAHLGPPTH